MVITIKTTCWGGEFDIAEFPHYLSHEEVGPNVVVTERIELDNERTQLAVEGWSEPPSAPAR